MHQHQYTYRPEPLAPRWVGVLVYLATFAVFAGIGVMLAWRG